jgi:hypothetical protein
MTVPWVRAAGLAIVIHLAFMFFLAFTLPGTPAGSGVDLVFWGGILRPQEVAFLPPNPSATVAEARIPLGESSRPQPYFRDRMLAAEKPFHPVNAVGIKEVQLLRFSGPRVELDEVIRDVDEPPVTLREKRP